MPLPHSTSRSADTCFLAFVPSVYSVIECFVLPYSLGIPMRLIAEDWRHDRWSQSMLDIAWHARCDSRIGAVRDCFPNLVHDSMFGKNLFRTLPNHCNPGHDS